MLTIGLPGISFRRPDSVPALFPIPSGCRLRIPTPCRACLWIGRLSKAIEVYRPLFVSLFNDELYIRYSHLPSAL